MKYKKYFTPRKASAIMVRSITQEAHQCLLLVAKVTGALSLPIIEWVILSLGSFQSGQMELTVNQLSEDFGGSNPSLPTDCLSCRFARVAQR